MSDPVSKERHGTCAAPSWLRKPLDAHQSLQTWSKYIKIFLWIMWMIWIGTATVSCQICTDSVGGFNSAITASETGANWQLAVQLMSCMPMMRLTSSVIRFLSRFIRLEWCIYFGVLCQLWNLWEGRLFVIWKHVKMCEDLWRLESWGLLMGLPSGLLGAFHHFMI